MSTPLHGVNNGSNLLIGKTIVSAKTVEKTEHLKEESEGDVIVTFGDGTMARLWASCMGAVEVSPMDANK